MKSLAKSKLSTKWPSFKTFIEKRTHGIETGIPCLDKYLLGLGGLVSIQGETSSCKSVLGLQIAHHSLQLGRPVLMIDKENGDGRVILRLICQKNLISEEEFFKTPYEKQKELCAKINDYPMHIHTETITGPEALEQRIKECALKYPVPFLVLIDSIQAMDRIQGLTERESLERWAYFFDQMKLDLEGRATLMFISEKNRQSYGTQGAGGGKGSNVVDYKPETILDIRYNEETDTFTVKVSKHRDGLKGAKFELRKVMSDKNSSRSFTFLLEETEIESEECDLNPRERRVSPEQS